MRHSRVRSFSSLLDASEDFSAGGATVSRSWRAWLDRRGDGAIASLVLGSLLVVGVLLGSVLPASDELHGPYRRISVMIGWTYFCRCGDACHQLHSRRKPGREGDLKPSTAVRSIRVSCDERDSCGTTPS